MLNLNRHRKTETKPTPTLIVKNCSYYVCARIVVQNCRTPHSTEQFR